MKNNQDDKANKDNLREKQDKTSKKLRPLSNTSSKPSNDGRRTVSDLDERIKAKTKVAPVATSRHNQNDTKADKNDTNDKNPNKATIGAVATRAPYQGKSSGRKASESEDLRTQTILSHMTKNDNFEKTQKQPNDESIEAGDGQIWPSQPDGADSPPGYSAGTVRGSGDNPAMNEMEDNPAAGIVPEEISIDETSENIEAFVVPTVCDASNVMVIPSDEELEEEARKKFIKKVMLVACILFVVVAGITVPVSLAVGGKEVTRPEKPSASPTFMPSSIPSVAPTSDRYVQAINILTDASLSDAAALFREQNVSTREQLLDKDSPQGKALNWIANEDSMGLDDIPKYMQRYIMAVFYFSMRGPHWSFCNKGSICSRKASWLSGEDECNWFGIECVMGKVSQIQTAQNRLEGEFPKEVCHFTEMTHINVFKNNIQGTLPACFGRFSKLQILSLYQNNIELPIHDEAVDGWNSLQVIILSLNDLAGPFPESLLKLSSLKELDLSYNALTGAFPEYNSSDAPLLDALDISGNKLRGDIPASLYNITELNVGNQKP